MALPQPIPEELKSFDLENEEVRGSVVFRDALEVRPDTDRTRRLFDEKLALLEHRRESARLERERREHEETQRRLREQEAKKMRLIQEQKRREEERKRQEEEEQRRQMEGGLDRILGHLVDNTSPAYVCCYDVDLGSVKLRLLAQSLSDNKSCQHVDLSRNGFKDDDGVVLAGVLRKNDTLQKLDLDGNLLGARSAHAFGEALKANSTLKSLSLDGAPLGGDDGGAGALNLIEGIGVNASLRHLSLSRCSLSADLGGPLLAAMQQNRTLAFCDVSHNALGAEIVAAIGEICDANSAMWSSHRRRERQQRFRMREEEMLTRTFTMQLESLRIETEATEERRISRHRERMRTWQAAAEDNLSGKAQIISELVADAEDRKDARGKKKKKK